MPLLNIVDETIKHLPVNSQKVTIFSTSSTFQSEIYQKGVIRGGHKLIFKEQWQDEINMLIQKIKLDKGNKENLDIWNELIEDVKKEDIESIIIACTHLNVVL